MRWQSQSARKAGVALVWIALLALCLSLVLAGCDTGPSGPVTPYNFAGVHATLPGADWTGAWALETK